MGMNPDPVRVRVQSITYEAEGISSWELVSPDDAPLPPFTAGAHIDLHMAGGLVRSYSLSNPQDERHRYVVTVKKDAAGKGGSKFVHEQVRVGDRLTVSPPRNNFTLVEDARHTIFVAGGIGITPIWCMIRRLDQLGRSWELHYSARERGQCAFRRELEALEAARGGRVHFNFDQETGGKPTDLAALAARSPPDAHVYCCGPKPMLQAFEAACADRPAGHVHVEYFSAKAEAATEGAFSVMLARSGTRFAIPAGKTILEVLLDHKIGVSFACMSGVCGACETRVLEGIPDHRDAVLSPEQQAAGKTMMICCSGSRTDMLVLDL
jgi:ferredoxin-NADP reductase